jgi:hypothetical protein
LCASIFQGLLVLGGRCSVLNVDRTSGLPTPDCWAPSTWKNIPANTVADI